ncbi:hypothetical protein GGI05_001341 [Coemansia sp. RSA 2603]|nr:hypothetical protein GGI05_001341 [Coemansia sp. RSA 2603]
MLSADADSAAAATWLPELNSPKLEIALPTTDAANTAAPAQPPEQPAPQTDSPQIDVESLRPASIASSDVAADYYYHLESVRSAASAELSHATESVDAHDPVALHLSRPATPRAREPDTVDSQTMLDHLGLDFDFTSDPAINDIASAPLFTMLAQPLPLPPLADSRPDATNPAQVVPEEPQQRKPRTRRPSIASILMRRASRCIDSSSPAIDSPVAAPMILAPENSSAHVDMTLEPATAASDATSSHGSPLPNTTAPSDLAPSEEQAPAQPASAHLESESATAEPSQEPAEPLDEPEHAVASADPVASDPAIPADSSDSSSDSNNDNNIVNDNSDSNNMKNVSDVAEPSTDSQEVPPLPSYDETTAPTPHEPASTHTIPTRRSPNTHNLDKRSSRILDGITRKVLHVRQTTSMVLRRSVGSRLSVIMPNMSTEAPAPVPVDHESHAALSASSGSAQDNESLESADATEARADQASDAFDGTVNADPAANVSAENNDNDNEVHDVDSHKPVVTAVSEPSSGHRGALSRKFTLVRRGTNEVVRNSVTRVKGIFASKKPVAA